MKSVTEFPSFTLTKGLQAKAALVADGKTPEEIQANLSETFKLEGDKAKFFMNALEVAGKNTENLKRVLVVSLNEGEAAPAKALKVDDHHYIPEMMTLARPTESADKSHGRGGRGGKGRGGDGKKGSPWGLSPEEKAAKNSPKQK